MSTMTPYAAATIINAKLASLNIDKKLPPQMMYNYAKQNYIENEIVKGKKRITSEGLEKWFAEYAKKNYKIEIKNENEDQLELFEI